MSTVFLNIGSNRGDRRRNISRAVAAIEKEFGYFELSHSVESEPWGFESSNPFINIGMMILSDLTPIEILHKLQDIERRLSSTSHRNPDGSYTDREIDIDIIAIDEIVIDSPELQIPHPHMAQRRFVLDPLAELAPFWTHPILRKTPTQLLSALLNADFPPHLHEP